MLARRDRVLFIGVKPLRIDVLTGISGVSFARAWKARISVDTDAGPIPVIDRRSLLVNKKASGRDKDLSDVRALTPRRAAAGGRAKAR